MPSLSAQKIQGHSKTCQSPAIIVVGGAYPRAQEAGWGEIGRGGRWEVLSLGDAVGSQWCLALVKGRSSLVPSEFVISPCGASLSCLSMPSALVKPCLKYHVHFCPDNSRKTQKEGPNEGHEDEQRTGEPAL